MTRVLEYTPHAVLVLLLGVFLAHPSWPELGGLALGVGLVVVDRLAVRASVTERVRELETKVTRLLNRG